MVLDYIPSKIKIESYNYTFTTKSEELDKGKFWNKKYTKEFLPPIERHVLKGIYEMYGLPKLDPKRKVKLSPFQLIPVVDLVLFISIIRYLFKLR